MTRLAFACLVVAVYVATGYATSCPAETNIPEFLTCMRGEANAFMKDNVDPNLIEEYEARKTGMEAALSGLGCDAPNWDAEIGSELPRLFRKILDKVKSAYDQASPEFKDCFADKLRAKITAKTEECLGFETENVATHILAFEPISMPKEEFILTFITRQINLQNAVWNCKQKLATEAGVPDVWAPPADFPSNFTCPGLPLPPPPTPETEALLNDFRFLDQKVTEFWGFREEICTARNTCSSGDTSQCIGSSGRLCECAIRQKEAIFCQSRQVQTQEGVEINDLIKTFGQVDSMRDLAGIIQTCHEQDPRTNGEELPKDVSNLIQMAVRISENPGALKKLRIRPNSRVGRLLKNSIIVFLQTFVQKSVACYECQ